MNADGTDIHQISFNQSHDRDATVLPNGRVLWSAGTTPPATTACISTSSNPDGTDLQLLYGAQQPRHRHRQPTQAIQFMRPREMQNGRILALVRQYTDADFGGDLVIIDANTYVENTQALLANAGMAGPGADPRHAQRRAHGPGPLARRPLQFRASRCGTAPTASS